MLTTCVGYADFLSLTLPQNMTQFDRVVVVTSHNDSETIAVCNRFEVELVLTERFFEQGAPFNKGKGMNVGVPRMAHADWVALVDADTIVPATLRSVFPNLFPGDFYWMERCIIETPEDYSRFQTTAALPDPARYGIEGSGYFHLIHLTDPNFKKPFSETCPTAGHVDLEFRDRWPFSRRILLPGRCVHLGPRAKNWAGRLTPRWQIAK